ncbi:hypothetical protein FVER53590_30398 [Fusarium verticillioides]|nr:hypothetical protein FVER53590_30398 [Fusarium verticillioides]
MPRTDVILLTEKELKTKIAQVLQPYPDPSKETKSHNRWIQGIVRNYTQFELRVRNPAYFNTGRYETWPNIVLGFSVGQFTAVNRDYLPSGATGGNAWDLEIQLGLSMYLSFVGCGSVQPAKPVDPRSYATKTFTIWIIADLKNSTGLDPS